MYLYKKNKERSITVYNFVPDNAKLIEFKKRYLDNIKSVKLHVNNAETTELLFSSPAIMFHALDRKEEDGRISYIEETKNNTKIAQYINGELDSWYPVRIVGGHQKSMYSGSLWNESGSLLFDGGSGHFSAFSSCESILLTGSLGEFQPLLSNDITYLEDIVEWLDWLDPEPVEFLKLFECTKQRIISMDDLRFLCDNGLICFEDRFEEALEKSEAVLKGYHKAKRMT